MLKELIPAGACGAAAMQAPLSDPLSPQTQHEDTFYIATPPLFVPSGAQSDIHPTFARPTEGHMFGPLLPPGASDEQRMHTASRSLALEWAITAWRNSDQAVLVDSGALVA